jgi:hypothetical protein
MKLSTVESLFWISDHARKKSHDEYLEISNWRFVSRQSIRPSLDLNQIIDEIDPCQSYISSLLNHYHISDILDNRKKPSCSMTMTDSRSTIGNQRLWWSAALKGWIDQSASILNGGRVVLIMKHFDWSNILAFNSVDSTETVMNNCQSKATSSSAYPFHFQTDDHIEKSNKTSNQRLPWYLNSCSWRLTLLLICSNLTIKSSLTWSSCRAKNARLSWLKVTLIDSRSQSQISHQISSIQSPSLDSFRSMSFQVGTHDAHDRYRQFHCDPLQDSRAPRSHINSRAAHQVARSVSDVRTHQIPGNQCERVEGTTVVIFTIIILFDWHIAFVMKYGLWRIIDWPMIQILSWVTFDSIVESSCEALLLWDDQITVWKQSCSNRRLNAQNQVRHVHVKERKFALKFVMSSCIIRIHLAECDWYGTRCCHIKCWSDLKGIWNTTIHCVDGL